MTSASTLFIVGNRGGTNVGESFRRAAESLGLAVEYWDTALADTPHVWLRRWSWHLRDRRAFHMGRFNRMLVEAAHQARPTWLLTSGLSPVSGATLEALRVAGVRCVHYSTDDPWNPRQRASWFLESLPLYDTVFSTRRANDDDFRRLGCRRIEYLPFAYDPQLTSAGGTTGPATDEARILFVGGGDRDRAAMLQPLADAGLGLAIYGSGWDEHSRLKPFAKGRADPPALCGLTLDAALNVCLVRRANRDGHVMRTFEIPAIGGFMLTEDTPEHREILGPDGECTVYFRDARDLVEKARVLLSQPGERHFMARAAHARITGGRNTYRDRLLTMLEHR